MLLRRAAVLLRRAAALLRSRVGVALVALVAGLQAARAHAVLTPIAEAAGPGRAVPPQKVAQREARQLPDHPLHGQAVQLAEVAAAAAVRAPAEVVMRG